jgi:hypothetical protein
MTLFQSEAVKELQLFIDARSQSEVHFYVSPLNLADFVHVISVPSNSTFVFSKFDTSLLNESYWEKATSSLPAGKYITNQEGMVFRSDYCPAGRLFRDGLGIDGEVISGNMVKFDLKSFLQVCELSRKSSCQIEWIAIGPENSQSYHNIADAFDTFSFTTPSQRIMYSATENTMAKIIFRGREDALVLIESILRDLVSSLSGSHVSHINSKTLDSIFEFADKIGLSISPEQDFINRNRTYELALNLGKTSWGAHHELLHGGEKLTLYYDRTSGIWALLT